MSFDVEFVRRQFPALDQSWILMDNAGGSVAPWQVSDRVRHYMRRYQVQLGASYTLSVEAGEKVEEGRLAMADFVGAAVDEIVLGPSTTLNLQLLAGALKPLFSLGDELVVTNLDHESNIGCWRQFAEAQGVTVREWRLNPESVSLELADLEPLLSEKTRLVCFTHCSNVVGLVHDVAAITQRVHEAGALVCVDGVAFAPHRRVDVAAWGVDIYAISLYKTYGPHLGLLYVKRDLLQRLSSRNHFFAGEGKPHLKLEPGNVNYELAASLPGILEYFTALDQHLEAASDVAAGEMAIGDRLTRTFARIAEHEERLATPLLEFLDARPGVRILGPPSGDKEVQVPTIAFVVDGRPSSEIPALLDPLEIAVRYGHFYAYRPIRDLGLLAQDGVVRVSLVHYNTEAEVDRLIEALDRIL